MKKNLIIIAVILLASSMQADNFEKIEKLKEEKRKIALQMHKKRVELIKTNPSLTELEKKIISLHKELAIRVDNNGAMRKLINKQKKIETEIKILENE